MAHAGSCADRAWDEDKKDVYESYHDIRMKIYNMIRY